MLPIRANTPFRVNLTPKKSFYKASRGIAAMPLGLQHGVSACQKAFGSSVPIGPCTCRRERGCTISTPCTASEPPSTCLETGQQWGMRLGHQQHVVLRIPYPTTRSQERQRPSRHSNLWRVRGIGSAKNNRAHPGDIQISVVDLLTSRRGPSPVIAYGLTAKRDTSFAVG